MTSATGFIYALIACFTNGSFMVPFKHSAVAELKINPIDFQIYTSFGIFVAALISIAFLPLNSEFIDGGSKIFTFVPYGFLSGCLMVLSMTFSFLSTRMIGLALAQGIFGGLSIVVSYIISLTMYGEHPTSWVMSIFGLVILVIGIVVIGSCRNISFVLLSYFPSLKQYVVNPNEFHPEVVNPLSKANLDTVYRVPDELPHQDPENIGTTVDDEPIEEVKKERSVSFIEQAYDFVKSIPLNFYIGCLYAVICGTIGGFVFVPLHYVDSKYNGIAYYPSFGLGSLVTAPIVGFIYHQFIDSNAIAEITSLTYLNKERILNSYKRIIENPLCLYAGIASGIIWSISSILTIGAIPLLGYGVAFPIVHCSVFISGLFGIYLFDELEHNRLASATFFFGGILLTIGAVMISTGK